LSQTRAGTSFTTSVRLSRVRVTVAVPSRTTPC
jgi:hypothetical protein